MDETIAKRLAKKQLVIEVALLGFVALLALVFYLAFDLLVSFFTSYYIYMPHFIAVVSIFTFILKARYKVLINERLQYSRSKSAWLINNDGVKPSFHSHQLINVELKDKNNNIRTVWKTLASEVDFSLNADEVVLSYMKSRH